MSIKEQVEKDIWTWVTDYIEVNNKFYDYKFPICPFAKSARVKGLVEAQAWESGSYKQFIRNSVDGLLANPDKEICIMVLPPRAKWSWGIPSFIDELNLELIPQGSFIQYGIALETTSKYPGLFNSGEYFVILVNNIDAVVEGHMALLKTQFYLPWSEGHYYDVVVRRQRLYNRYRHKNIDNNS